MFAHLGNVFLLIACLSGCFPNASAGLNSVQVILLGYYYLSAVQVISTESVIGNGTNFDLMSSTDSETILRSYQLGFSVGDLSQLKHTLTSLMTGLESGLDLSDQQLSHLINMFKSSSDVDYKLKGRFLDHLLEPDVTAATNTLREDAKLLKSLVKHSYLTACVDETDAFVKGLEAVLKSDQKWIPKGEVHKLKVNMIDLKNEMRLLKDVTTMTHVQFVQTRITRILLIVEQLRGSSTSLVLDNLSSRLEHFLESGFDGQQLMSVSGFLDQLSI